MPLLFDQPEIFSTINIIPGIAYKNISIALFFGGFLILFCLLFFFLKRKSKIIDKNFNNIIFILFLIFWTPLFVNFFYNNTYDFIENFEYAKYDISGKRILRYCNMDNRQGLSGLSCMMFSFFTFSKNNIPEHSKVKLLASPNTAAYFYYYLYPYFKITKDINESEYLLYYYSPNFKYTDGKLYQIIFNKPGDYRDVKEEVEIGEYSAVANLGPGRLILKKPDK